MNLLNDINQIHLYEHIVLPEVLLLFVVFDD